jgi:hypothetical protein
LSAFSPAAQRAFQHRPLLHPVVIASLVLLVVNDHWLKGHYSSWATGKLSDVAFMVLSPIWLAVLVGYVVEGCLPRKRTGACLSAGSQRLILGLMIGSVGVLFTSMQLTEAGDWFYRSSLGALQWPTRAIWELTRGNALPAPLLVATTRDPSDLLCLPFLAIAWSVGLPRGQSS